MAMAPEFNGFVSCGYKCIQALYMESTQIVVIHNAQLDRSVCVLVVRGSIP